jgi:polysaccharide pyruvyl transferase CsaB
LKKKLAITAFIGSDNLGDEAVLMSILSCVIENMENISIILFSKNKKKTEDLIEKLANYVAIDDINIINSKDILSILKALYQCDVCICGGGGLLQDQTSVFNIPYHVWKIFVAKILGRKIMFFAVGAGPIDTWTGRTITSMALSMADAITVRDEDSKKILAGLNEKLTRICVSADPAINLPIPQPDIIDKIFFTENVPLDKPLVGICLRHWFDTYRLIPVSIVKKFNIQTKKDKIKNTDFIIHISHALDSFLDEHDVNVLFIPFWTGRDHTIHEGIISNMRNAEQTFTISQSYCPDEIKGIISRLDIMVGMRLHSLIIASSLGIPFVGIMYAPKVKHFIYSILERVTVENSTVHVDNFNDIEFKSRLDYVYSNRENLRYDLERRVELIRKLEKKNIESLMNIFGV